MPTFQIGTGLLAAMLAAAVCSGQPASSGNPGVAWPATDTLGRTLPTSQDVGVPRANRTVAMFYFLWHEKKWTQGPFDVTKILAADPTARDKNTSPPWGPLHYPHHWGESIFGYYLGDDESVLRKHAQMLADAGVDVVIFDVSNKVTYRHNYTALMRVFQEIRQQGNRTPQVAFLTPFWEPDSTVRELFQQLYSQRLFEELWFRWDGKPLILADPNLLFARTQRTGYDSPVLIEPGSTLGQSLRIPEPFNAVYAYFPTYRSTSSAVTLSLYHDAPTGDLIARKRFHNVVDNGQLVLELDHLQPSGVYYLEASDAEKSIGWWSSPAERNDEGTAYSDGRPVAGDRSAGYLKWDPDISRIREFFTFRKPQPDYFQGPTGPDQWSWLEIHPQHVFQNSRGEKEQMSAGVGQNAVGDRLGSMSEPDARGRSYHGGHQAAQENAVLYGYNFAEQWERVLKEDPQAVFVTGWNEWIAGRFDEFNHIKTPPMFVDQFDQEHSRDIEPMKGGHGDNYYYQLVSNVRRYKGVPAIPLVTSQPILLDGRFDDWRQVAPEFRDTVGDPVQRNHAGWNKAGPYIDQSGRNDIVVAKVSFDEQQVFFYVRTRMSISPCSDPSWMLLLIDADANPKTGWLGYDFQVNGSGVTDTTTTVRRNVDGQYRWHTPVSIEYRVAGNELELAIPRSVLGLPVKPRTFDFKWADNSLQTGEATDFTLHGDAAPNDRFNYRVVPAELPQGQ